MKITWQNISVQKFQDIIRITASLTPEEQNIEKAERIHRIIFGLTETQFNEKSLAELKQMSRAIDDLLIFNIPGKPARNIKVAGRRFKIQYNPMKLNTWQQKKVIQNSSFLLGNLHMIMASIVEPADYGLKYFKTGFKREASFTENEYADIANLMLQVPITIVFHTCNYFSKLFVNVLKELAPTLRGEMITTGMPAEVADQLLSETSKSVESLFHPH